MLTRRKSSFLAKLAAYRLSGLLLAFLLAIGSCLAAAPTDHACCENTHKHPQKTIQACCAESQALLPSVSVKTAVREESNDEPAPATHLLASPEPPALLHPTSPGERFSARQLSLIDQRHIADASRRRCKQYCVMLN